MMIYLDTSYLILALRAGTSEERKVRDWVTTGEILCMSTVAWTEFLCGPLNPSELALASEIVGPSRDFTTEHAAGAAELFNKTGRRRGSLIDCMIAAVALIDRIPIATANVSDFRRFEDFGLRMA